MKQCSKCKEFKPIDKFSINNPSCKVCIAKYSREYYLTYKKEKKIYTYQWRKNHPQDWNRINNKAVTKHYYENQLEMIERQKIYNKKYPEVSKQYYKENKTWLTQKVIQRRIKKLLYA